MKFKGIVLKHPLRRLVALLCFSVGGIVWYWQMQPDSAPTSFLVRLPSAPETVVQNRNLSECDYGGIIPYCINNFEISAKKCEALEKQARDFISDHWVNKKRGYIIIRYGGIDVSGERYVFIEPNTDGQWEVIWREDLGRSNFIERGFGKNIRVETARTVVTRRATNSDADYGYRSGTTYLIFFDKDGNEVTEY